MDSKKVRLPFVAWSLYGLNYPDY